VVDGRRDLDRGGMHSRHPFTTRIVLAAATSALILGAAACGDDDDDDTAAPATDAPAETTAAPAADNSEFCDNFITAVEATSSEDPAVIGPAFEAALASAPAEIKPAVETVTSVSDDDPAFGPAYGEVLGFVKGNCGFTELDVTTKEYSFEGLPQEVAAGPSLITMDNQGAEFHEVILFKVNDGVTDTAIDLLSLPDEEFESKMSFAGATMGPPGEPSMGVARLTPGRYLAVCFLPQGATPEMMEQMDGPDSSLPEGAGPPHFMAGMVQEFNVA
jgi:hypothetical protein